MIVRKKKKKIKKIMICLFNKISYHNFCPVHFDRTFYFYLWHYRFFISATTTLLPRRLFWMKILRAILCRCFVRKEEKRLTLLTEKDICSPALSMTIIKNVVLYPLNPKSKIQNQKEMWQ